MSRSIYKKIAGALSVLLLPLVVYAVTQDKTAKFTEWVKIGGSANAHSTAALDINSITKGILIPRMTEAQRDAIQNPATGLQVYNTDTNKINIYNGAGWEIVSELTGSEITALLAAKAPLDSPTFTGTITTPLTASRVLQTNASSELEASSVTTTELGFLSGVTSSLCGINQSCTLTNKTLTNFLLNGSGGVGAIDLGTASNLNMLTLPRAALATLESDVTPSAGTLAYDETNNRPVFGDGSVWQPVGSGSGSGGKNYAQDYFDGTSISNISSSDEGLTVTVNKISNPLRAEGNQRFSKDAADREGHFFLIPLQQLDVADRDGLKPLYVRFNYRTSANYVSDDVKFSIISGENELDIISSDTGSGGLLAASETRAFTGVFYPQSDTTEMALAISVQSSNASAYDIDIIDLQVSPQGTAPGAIQTEWKSFTPTLNSLTSVGTRVGAWRRVGDTMEIQAFISYTGVGDASNFSITIPNGETIDTDKLNNQFSGSRNLGTVLWLDNGTSFKIGNATVVSTTSVGFVQDGSGGFFQTSATGNGDALSLILKVPIQGWAASQIVGTNEFLKKGAFVRAVKGSGTHGSPGTFIDVTDWTEEKDSHNAFNASTGVFTCVTSEPHLVIGNLAFQANANGTTRGVRILYDSSEVARFGVSHLSSTTAQRISFGTVIDCLQGHTIKIQAHQDTGASLNYNSSTFDNTLSIYSFSALSAWTVVPKAPTITRLTSGSGTYVTPSGVRYLRVRMVGGGAGGNGSGTSNSGGRGAAGGNTTFGTSFLVAGGAPQPPQPTGGNYHGGDGGTVSVGSGATAIVSIAGAKGQTGVLNSSTSQSSSGGAGGASPFGGAGVSTNTSAGTNALANTGSGGGGGGSSTVSGSGTGGGGGSGGYIEALIYNPASSYTYSVGSGGAGGSAGTDGRAGGNGGSGVIIIEEHY